MSEQGQNIFVKTISSMEKIFPLSKPQQEENFASVLQGERLNFQLAFYNNSEDFLKKNRIEIESDIKEYITLRIVGNVPVEYTPSTADDYYLDTKPGLYPDVLKPIGGMGVLLIPSQWRAVWVSIDTEKVESGKHEITFRLYSEKNELLAEALYQIDVIAVKREKNSLLVTNWVHCDCICAKHGVKPFTPAFYKIFKEYLKAYVDIGNNMLLTPIFTPPLDTEVGIYRETVQLIDVEKDGEKYQFNFDKFKKFVNFAKEYNIKYFELSHLFTQWGGKACPKIMGKENGEEKMLFGWDIASDSPEYKNFLGAFLPELCQVLKELKIDKVTYFHLTDEPHEEHFEYYKNCSETVKKYIGDYPIIDAMSHYEYKKEGLVDIPVVVTDALEGFSEMNNSDLMVYTCCLPDNGYYSNRFINMPSLRTRILGVQLYQTGVAGYLHWGFNFYNSWLSLEEVDPYASTTAGGRFPAGDSFVVYPTKDGVVYSLRAELLKEGIQDYEALLTLEKLAGKKETKTLLQEFFIQGYTDYPKDNETYRKFREKLNEKIAECLK